MARILVIEDEPDIRQVLDYNLRMAGHDVLAAAEGQIGLRMVHDQKPDLVLLDLMLPDISGTEVCRSIKDDNGTRAIPVIVLTAKGEEIDRVVGFELARTTTSRNLSACGSSCSEFARFSGATKASRRLRPCSISAPCASIAKHTAFGSRVARSSSRRSSSSCS
jgi:CheY-like chemotaxis protein